MDLQSASFNSCYTDFPRHQTARPGFYTVSLQPGAKFGRYEIHALLGVGGMGEVYLAEDTHLRRKIALKVLPETIARDKDRLRRFELEAFAASALNHPNILTVYEFGVEQATHFLAAEFVSGETEAGFCMAPAAIFLHSAIIFSTAKLSAQPSSAALSENKPGSDACNDYHSETNN